MHREVAASRCRDAADPGIVPDIGAITPGLTQAEAVHVRCVAVFEHKDQLVLRAIEGPHPAVRFVPYDEVLELDPAYLACLAQLAHVPPVHADVQDGPRPDMLDHARQRSCQEVGKLGRTHFASGHRELAVLELAKTADMPVNRDVVRRVGEHDPARLARHQRCVVIG